METILHDTVRSGEVLSTDGSRPLRQKSSMTLTGVGAEILSPLYIPIKTAAGIGAPDAAPDLTDPDFDPFPGLPR